VSSDEVTIRWKEPSFDGGAEITGYHVYRTSDDGKKVLFAELEPNKFSFTDRTVTSGKFTYSVAAVNSLGEGEEATEDVEVPSRILWVITALIVALIIPIVVLLLAAYLPGYLKMRRERKEREAAEAKLAIERQSTRQLAGARAPGLPSAGYSPNQLGNASTMNSQMRQLPPSPQPAPQPSSQPAGDDGGYIRPTDMKKKRADKKKVLRSDGKSMEEKEQEKHISELRSNGSKDHHDWKDDKKKALEKEADSIFTGQQPGEAPKMKAPPKDIPMEREPLECDVADDVKEEEVPGSEPPEESIPDWNCQEVPVQDEPPVIDEEPSFDEDDIDELEEVEELEELEDE
jgi:type II secretory pathway pseudopilin PulG